MELPDPVQTETHISTGSLPASHRVAQLMTEAHRRFSSVDQGAVSQVYPALAQMPAHLFGICAVGVDGQTYAVGDALHEFTIMSVSKPFVFALVCDLLGPTGARERLGVNATGYPFNSLAGIERLPGGRSNPMVNAGAIATTSLIPGATIDERWAALRDGLSRFAGRELALNEDVLTSALASNFRNRSLAWMLQGFGSIYSDPAEALELYTRQCALQVSARDLAVMGATLANGGFNPITREQVVKPQTCHHTLAVMLTAGLYETSGDWLYEIGLPGKSGVSGGIVTVAPGKAGLGLFSPPLDEAGNSVRGQLVAQFLSQRLGLDMLISAPSEAR
ncbi:glutaminase A [Paracoccus sp. PAR01]|uniref:glutaminase A n=1 Tax=Paracoccus sp. PAR01 TaxID=2769282 RepID=UPI00178018AD|nr:glutaminase A [Paracoccus sp. PAR01]MBD9527640.1 glutaminase A [Paracoccus sp. PAR01]